MADARVVLLTLGGTISMTGGSGGVVSRLGGADLLRGASAREVTVEVVDQRASPSADLTFGDLVDVVETAQRSVAAGATGVVVSQGSDTLEETAFLVDCLWIDDAPVVLTGAMRNPTLPGADGPANLRAALSVAAAPAARGRGALVVLADEIHAAREVRKAHSTRLTAFASPDSGPVGHVVEGLPRFLAATARTPPVAGVDRGRLDATRVALHTVALDDGPVPGHAHALAGLPTTHHGLVVAAFGVGHVPGALAPVLGAVAERIPVVLTSRAGGGPVLADTYGAAGSERDLRARGLIGAGRLSPYQARVLLRLLLAAGAGPDAVRAAFRAYDEG